MGAQASAAFFHDEGQDAIQLTGVDQYVAAFVAKVRDINDRRRIIGQKRDVVASRKRLQAFSEFQNGQGA